MLLIFSTQTDRVPVQCNSGPYMLFEEELRDAYTDDGDKYMRST